MDTIDIDNIRNKIKKINDNEYKKHNYEPELIMLSNGGGSGKGSGGGSKREKLVPHGISLIASSKLNKKLKQIQDCDSDKNTRNKNKNNIGIMDIVNGDDIFNVIDANKEYLKWKQLEIDTQIEKVKHYCNKNKINIAISTVLQKMINDKKLYLKKDIVYDTVNQCIVDIPYIDSIDDIGIVGGNKNAKKRKKNGNSKTVINRLMK